MLKTKRPVRRSACSPTSAAIRSTTETRVTKFVALVITQQVRLVKFKYLYPPRYPLHYLFINCYPEKWYHRISFFIFIFRIRIWKSLKQQRTSWRLATTWLSIVALLTWSSESRLTEFSAENSTPKRGLIRVSLTSPRDLNLSFDSVTKISAVTSNKKAPASSSPKSLSRLVGKWNVISLYNDREWY